jgi:hypothetical protein
MVRMIGHDDTGEAGHAARGLRTRETSIECTVTVIILCTITVILVSGQA